MMNVHLAIMSGNITIILMSLKLSIVLPFMIVNMGIVVNCITMILNFIIKAIYNSFPFLSSLGLILDPLKLCLAKNNVNFLLNSDGHDKNSCLFYHNNKDKRRENFNDYDHI